MQKQKIMFKNKDLREQVQSSIISSENIKNSTTEEITIALLRGFGHPTMLGIIPGQAYIAELAKRAGVDPIGIIKDDE